MIEITLIALLVGFIYLFIKVQSIITVLVAHSQGFGASAHLFREMSKEIEELKKQKGDKDGI